MKDIEILEKELRNIRNLIDYYTFESLDYDKKYRMERFKTAIENILKERQADKEKIKELESDKEIKNKIIDRMAEYINKLYIDEDICTKNIINPELCNEQYSNCKECIKQYFENLAKESGEIDEGR